MVILYVNANKQYILSILLIFPLRNLNTPMEKRLKLFKVKYFDDQIFNNGIYFLPALIVSS
jgi:hypothetical protein